jgi:hypothetical protein
MAPAVVLLLATCVAILVSGVSIVIKRRVTLRPGWEMRGRGAVLVGLAVFFFGPPFLLVLVTLASLLLQLWGH